MPPSLAFLHTSPVHVPTFTALLESIDSDASATHFVDEALLRDARAQGHDSPGVVQRVQEAVRVAAETGACVVVCTCSTIGAAAEATPTHGKFTAKRIDRAMANAAARAGPNVLVVAALQSTLGPTSDLIRDSAQRLGLQVKISEHHVSDAWQHFEQGNLVAYYAAIEAEVRKLLPGPSVVVLAQASMAPAAAALYDVAVPVLSSPALGVQDALGIA
ncbi:aspartate/glutamate racemase family protein [Limnohabitans sp. DM1]|uniref:aspartate/glutamate racemase family protein n=1 Tax=Limnohabitans sp. DM1 TaxID=1597955 RepID=UPI000B2D4DC1|nr:aspartate/glutamate racemase family protein [Limnohabitans sp. DM1]